MKKIILKFMAVAAVFSMGLCSCDSNKADKSSDISMTISSDDPMNAYLDYFDALLSNDAETVILMTTPVAYLEEMKLRGMYDTLVTQTEDIVIKYALLAFNEQYGEDIYIDFKEELKKTPLSEEQLGYALQCYNASYGHLSAEINIIEGYEITYTYEIAGSKTSEEKSETACFVRVENDCWKMLPVTADTLKEYKEMQNVLSQQ